jgi:hypothetical protein
VAHIKTAPRTAGKKEDKALKTMGLTSFFAAALGNVQACMLASRGRGKMGSPRRISVRPERV